MSARVAQKYVQPEKLAIVVVGNDVEITPPLKQLGPVTTLDITIPGAPPQAVQACNDASVHPLTLSSLSFEILQPCVRGAASATSPGTTRPRRQSPQSRSQSRRR